MNKEKITSVILGPFLVLTGSVNLVSGLGDLEPVAPTLALVAGVLILAFTPGVSLRLSLLLAAIYLLIIGSGSLLNLSISGIGTVMAIPALVGGALLLVRIGRFKGSLGYLLFFVWLILMGLSHFPSLGAVSLLVDIAALELARTDSFEINYIQLIRPFIAFVCSFAGVFEPGVIAQYDPAHERACRNGWGHPVVRQLFYHFAGPN